jgi:hypothetical protein
MRRHRGLGRDANTIDTNRAGHEYITVPSLKLPPSTQSIWQQGQIEVN